MTEFVRHAVTDKYFLAGGSAVFTVQNPAGEHHTYRINKRDEKSPYFVGYLYGPDNVSNYRYLGVYIPQKGEVLSTRKSPPSSKQLEIVRWAVKVLHGEKKLPPGYSIMHAGRCCVCGRRLTVPKSIEHGIGPVCADNKGLVFNYENESAIEPKERLAGLKLMIADLEKEIE